MTDTTLILPGLHGSGPDHWQSWWLREDRHARLVAQADWDAPRLDSWSDRVSAAVTAAPGAILVAHSLGCALVADIAARRPDLPIGGALLVAPADVDHGDWTAPGVAAFGPMPLAPFGFPATVVASRDDPYVTLVRARGFARSWGADLIDLGNAGHINALSGYGPWPEGLRLVRQLRTLASERVAHSDRGANERGPVTDALALALFI